MAPMISTADEAARFASLCAAAGLQTAGIMAEVPSAALTAAAVLGQGRFASIGTNDLTQYAMAGDRQLAPLANLNSTWQPAALRLIQPTVAGAAEEGNGKPVGVCGEAAPYPALAVVLVGLGVTTLSMTSPGRRRERAQVDHAGTGTGTRLSGPDRPRRPRCEVVDPRETAHPRGTRPLTDAPIANHSGLRGEVGNLCGAKK
jgi:phosphoenolpyruvate-protein kinase (PTS system EI component)